MGYSLLALFPLLCWAQFDNQTLDWNDSPDWTDRPIGDEILPELLLVPRLAWEQDLVVGFLTSRRKERDLIRKWVPLLSNNTVSIVFPKGRQSEGKGEKSEKELVEEAMKHQDIIIGNFIEGWQTLSGNIMTLLQWFVEYSSSSLLAKVDSDVTINWRTFVSGLLEYAHNPQRDLKGRIVDGTKDIWWGGVPMGGTNVIKDPSNKYYEPNYQKAVFPEYVSGVTWAMNKMAALEIIQRRQENRIRMRNDDALIGVLFEAGEEVQPVELKRVLPWAQSHTTEKVCGSGVYNIWSCHCDRWWAYHSANAQPIDWVAFIAALSCISCPQCSFPKDIKRFDVIDWIDQHSSTKH